MSTCPCLFCYQKRIQFSTEIPPHCIEHLDERTNITFSICEVSSGLYLVCERKIFSSIGVLAAAGPEWITVNPVYCDRGRHLSYQRGKRNTNPGTRYVKGFVVGDSSRHTETHRVTADSERSLIQIEGVNDTKAAKLVYAIALFSIKSKVLIVSILARRSPLSTVHSEKSEGQKFESSGVKSLGHTVRAAHICWWS